ncbi:hypothetical protein GQ53DRAFT_753893 [Thozetella sp. PMI_491]|nr:hypothetical protein GQ53DRAFT_753893 [Thozetella sp. PMI_491]
MARSANDISDWEEIVVRLEGNRTTPSSADHASIQTAPFVLESIQDRITRFTADESDLTRFYAVSFSSTRAAVLKQFYEEQLREINAIPFLYYDQQSKVDIILLKKYIERQARRLELDQAKDVRVFKILPFLTTFVEIVEARQSVSTTALQPKTLATQLHQLMEHIQQAQHQIQTGHVRCDNMTGYRAVRAIQELRQHLEEFYKFLKGYDPLFDWWVSKPYSAVLLAFDELLPVVEVKLAGVRLGDKDEIIGDAIGREGLLAELEAEVIPYTPEQLLVIARRKYAWCEAEAKKAADELGFGDDWKAALEKVKNMYLEPGEQPGLVKQLVEEGAEYVKTRDLVTVPPVAEQTWRMFMMSPEAQKVNPFFLGGTDIIASYPTADMGHADKLMSMRGNNKPMSRATAFHEMIPGHHLQMFMSERYRPYRRLFTTPFYVEGWAMYWEMVLWNNGDFFTTPEDRIGTLFWRMHRCARIIFSLNFHLNQMTPQECVDLLVDMVGHERATAEGEVRRSLNGSYSPLYQAGYMLGALQLYSLRTEVLSRGTLGEKQFHDLVLRSSEMPIEMLRALVFNTTLTASYKAQWKFEGDIQSASALR